MAETYYPSPRKDIVLEDTQVEIEVRGAKQALKRELRNYFSKYGLERDTGAYEDQDIPAGLIEDIALRRCVKRIAIGGHDLKWDAANDESPIDALPEDFGMGNDPDEVDLYEEIIKTAVDRNRFLAYRYPFGLVFGQYFAMIEQEKEDAKAEAEGREPKTVTDIDSSDPTNQTTEGTSSVERISSKDIVGQSD